MTRMLILTSKSDFQKKLFFSKGSNVYSIRAIGINDINFSWSDFLNKFSTTSKLLVYHLTYLKIKSWTFSQENHSDLRELTFIQFFVDVMVDDTYSLQRFSTLINPKQDHSFLFLFTHYRYLGRIIKKCECISATLPNTLHNRHHSASRVTREFN